MKYIALIPSYEPDNKLLSLVNKLIDNKFIVIVVNDGSSKKYDDVFNKLDKKCIYLKYDNNMGKGYALKYGYKYINSNYSDYIVVTMDCDGQHRIEDAIKLCDYVSDNPYTLCLGKRLRGEFTPLRSRVGNGITKLVFYLSTGTKIYDTQTGLRCFSNKIMDYNLKIPGNRFEYEMNVLLNLSKNNIDVHEIEIETIYFDNNKGSHFNTIKDSFKIYKEILLFSLSSIIINIMDLVMYILFTFIFNSYISNIISKLVSFGLKYIFNRKNILKYIIFSILLIIINTGLLELLIYLGFNKFLSKVIVEIGLYFILLFSGIRKRF